MKLTEIRKPGFPTWEEYLSQAEQRLDPDQLGDWKDLLWARWEAGVPLADAMADIEATIMSDEDYYDQ